MGQGRVQLLVVLPVHIHIAAIYKLYALRVLRHHKNLGLAIGLKWVKESAIGQTK